METPNQNGQHLQTVEAQAGVGKGDGKGIWSSDGGD